MQVKNKNLEKIYKRTFTKSTGHKLLTYVKVNFNFSSYFPLLKVFLEMLVQTDPINYYLFGKHIQIYTKVII